MPLHTAPDREDRTAAARAPAPELPLAAYAAGLPGAVELQAQAETDAQLAAQLMALPPLERQAAALHDPRCHHPSLATLLVLQAESELFDPAADARPTAELAAAVASALPRDPAGKARRLAALAYWLLGKALLKDEQWCLADECFQSMSAFIPAPGPSAEAALAIVGRAQLCADTGATDDAVCYFLLAAYRFTQLGQAQPAAACQAELGLLLLGTGDLLSARLSLDAGVALLDPAASPSLAARLRLGLAEIATALDDRAAAGEQLRRARALYPLAPAPTDAPEAIVHRWWEARIAAAAADSDAADRLIESVRGELLARGSLAEAARCTFDAVLLCIDTYRWAEVRDLTSALARAFPGRGQWWAGEMRRAAALARRDPEGAYAPCWEIRDRLRHAMVLDLGRPPLLRPARALTDRVLRGRGELADPIGAAGGL